MQRQIIDVPLAQGLNQKADKRYLELGGHAQLTNCRKQKSNAIVKRPGHLALTKTVGGGAASTIGAAIAGGSARGVPWLSDGQTLNVYSDAAAEWLWQSKLPEAQVTDRVAVASVAALVGDLDYCMSSGYRLVIYTSPYLASPLALLWTVLDATTGAVVVPAQQVDSSLSAGVFGARVTLCGTKAILTYVLPSTGFLYARSLDLSTLTGGAGWSAATAIITDGSTTLASLGLYDAAPVTGDATRFVISYENATGISHGTLAGVIRVFNTSFTLLQTATGETTDSSLGPFAVYATNGGDIWTVYNASSTSPPVLRTWRFTDGIPGSPDTPSTVYVWPNGTSNFGNLGIVPNGAGGATCMWSLGTSSPIVPTGQMAVTWTRGRQMAASGGAISLGQQRFSPGIVLASRPIVTGGLLYALTWIPSALQGTYFLTAFEWYGTFSSPNPWAARCVAVVAPRLGYMNSSSGNATVPHIFNDSGSLWSVPVSLSTQPNHHAVYVEGFDFASTLKHVASGDLGGTSDMAITAGQMTAHDGSMAFELGYTYYPELGGEGGPGPVGIVVSATGGGIETGTQAGIPQIRQYLLVYEWYDALGNVHRSAPSPPMTADMSGLSNGTTGSVVLTMPCIGLTQRRYGMATVGGGGARQQTQPNEVYIVPYRTNAGGTIFYRVPADPAPAALLSSDTASTISYTDQIGDTNAFGGTSLLDGTHALVYTTGGVLPNMGPPGGRAFCVHDGRYFVAGCDDPTAVWPSKQYTPGEVQGFHENLAFNATGAVRALASLDGNLIVFVQRTDGYGVEFVSGQGPLDNGMQSDWTPPQRIPCDTGAVDQRSVCAFPGGVLFRGTVGGPNGTGGIFVLSRDFQVQYIGGPVEDTLSALSVVTSMRLHPNAGRIYIECVDSDTAPSFGFRIVWDYIMGVWSIDHVYDADTAGSPGSRFAWVANAGTIPTYHWATVGGRVYRETVGTGSGANTDAGHWVTMSGQTAELKSALSQAIRFWRVQMQADSVDPCNFTMTLTFDGAPASYYSENLNGSNPSFTAGAIASFDRYPQVDVEQYVGNQLAKSITIAWTDAPPTGGPSYTTGAGLSVAAFSLEIGTDGSKRYPNIPAGQRG